MSKEKQRGLSEKQWENRKEDKKALGKFALALLLAFAVGIGVGLGSSFLEDVLAETSVKETFVTLMRGAAIYGGYVFTTALLIACVVLHKKSRKEYLIWDEEDEEVMSAVETKISYVNWFANLIMYGAYFFFSTGVWATDALDAGFALAEDKNAFWISLGAVFAHMAYAMLVACVVQQKTVNLYKEINPEKKGSVYDMKFQDKWLENCDEAERFETYKCSFKTFKIMQVIGLVLWLVCLVGQMVFKTGAFATIIVTIYMIIQISVYSLQGIYFAKHPSEVMK